MNLWPSALQRLHCVQWNIKGDELAIACEDGVVYMYHLTLARVSCDGHDACAPFVTPFPNQVLNPKPMHAPS